MTMQIIPGPRGLIAVRAEAPADVKAAIEAVNRAFETFKAEHKGQLDEVKKGFTDVVRAEKIDRVNDDISKLQASIDDMNVKIAATQVGAGSTASKTPEQVEYDKSFNAHFRRGDINATLSRGSDPDGGYLAPIEWDRTITDKLKLVSAIRRYSTVQQISGAGFKKLFNDRVTGSGWVGETAARPQTSTPQLGQLDFIPGEIYANPAASQQILDDSEINIEQWLASEVEFEFARQEGIAFLSGDGVNKPFGLLNYATGGTAAARHPFGAIAVVNSGAAAALTSDGIISIIYDLPADYSANARFFGNRQTIAAMRKLKDGQGNYLWQPTFQAGQPSTLAGVDVVDIPDMPAIVAGNLALAYGDMAETYLVIDRIGVRVLRDPYTNKPFVHFYTTKRVGGGVKNPLAMRFLKISA